MTSKPDQGELFSAPPARLWVGEIERDCRRRGLWPVIGTDEAGRGPLAGPVVAAAVVLRDGARLPGLDDSKLLSEAAREALVPAIEAGSAAFSVVEADVARIDALNILGASLWAMRQAVGACWAQLQAQPSEGRVAMPALVLVDGNRRIPDLVRPAQRTIVKGDRRSRAIAAASILAKVHRDHLMVALAEVHPGYGFEIHKGYPTPAHLQALDRLGPCAAHRPGFKPVAEALARRR